MIFDSNMSAASATNWDAVQESPYALGIEGGLMHVYENECNYNAIMKSAGISELKYYKENGGDLFVQEAGAAGGFINKFINFFKKVIEKIKQIFKKFVMTISSYVSSDKKFVNKYKKEVFKNFKEFDFDGWKFDFSKVNTDAAKVNTKVTAEDFANSHSSIAKTDEDIEDTLNSIRGKVVGSSSSVDESDFQDELHDALYGDSKEEFKVTASECAKCFEIISDTSRNIKDAEKDQREITKDINDYIKKLEKARDIIVKSISDNDNKINGNNETKNNRVNAIAKDIEFRREISNIATIAFSAKIGAYKDQNRQCKAICVKALNSGSRKDESAVGGDIFAGVEII